MWRKPKGFLRRSPTRAHCHCERSQAISITMRTAIEIASPRSQ
jgi:hypothetical protein